MTGHRTKLSGFAVKDGKLVPVTKKRRQSVSDRIKARKSKRVKVVRPTLTNA